MLANRTREVFLTKKILTLPKNTNHIIIDICYMREREREREREDQMSARNRRTLRKRVALFNCQTNRLLWLFFFVAISFHKQS